MATLDALPGIKFEVICEGHALKEYDVELSTHAAGYPQYESYIEARSGAQFKIRTTVSERLDWIGPAFAMHLKIDGNCLCSGYVDQHNMTAQRQHDFHRAYEFVGPRYQDENTGEYFDQPFVFQQLSIVEDDPSSQQQRNEKLGTIEMSIWRSQRDQTQGSILSSRALPKNASTVVSEKSLKKAGAVSHSCGLGDSVPASRLNVVKVLPLDRYPVATYTWNYRSLDALCALGIVEAAADPEPIKSPEPVKNEPADITAIKTEIGLENHPQKRGNAAAPDEDGDDVEFLLSLPRKRKKTAPVRPAQRRFFGETIVLDD